MDLSGRPLDLIIVIGAIAAYFGFILWFGSYVGRFTRSTSEYFYGGQRFSWWLIGFSLLSTTVGSYSFIKYSEIAFTHGLASSMAYLNDWFWLPLLCFVWVPIILFSRVRSIPEYFERRFSRPVRLTVTIILLVYILGSIGVNLYTMGLATCSVLGLSTSSLLPVFGCAAVAALFTTLYVTAGGQSAIIMTDFIQAVLLLAGGILVFGLGMATLGGFGGFWGATELSHRLPLSYFNKPANFNFVGVFWQDAICTTFYSHFLSQGMVQRFMSSRSLLDVRKGMVFLLLLLQPLGAIAVSSAGWIGHAMVNKGLMPAGIDARNAFTTVAHFLTLSTPGLFGVMLATLTVAMMSAIDALINSVSAVWVNDIWRVYVRPNAPDSHHLKVGKIVSLLAGSVGLLMVPLFFTIGSIYKAHAAFAATIAPPLVISALFGMLWKRFTPFAAMCTLIGGMAAIWASIVFPDLIQPFSLGVERGGQYMAAWSFQRALYGLFVSASIGVVAASASRRSHEPPPGLMAQTITEGMERYKGGALTEVTGRRAQARLEVCGSEGFSKQRVEVHAQETLERWIIHLPQRVMDAVDASPGDLVCLSDHRPWLGGLRAEHGVCGAPSSSDRIQVPEAFVKEGLLRPERPVVVEKTL